MKQIKLITLTLLMLTIFVTTAHAQCNCICVNNEKTHICENGWDVPVGFCSGWCYGR